MATIADYRLSVRTMIRDTAGLGATPNPSQFIFQDWEIDAFTQSAVLAYSKYRGRRKPYTLTLQPGQSQYPLPADWMTVDLASFHQAIGLDSDVDLSQFASFVLPSLNPSIPLKDLTFDWYDSDQFVLVSPTPQATATINFAYFAAHTVDQNGSSIPSADFDYVVLAAASRVLDTLAVDRGMKMQKYKIGQGLMIDDSEVAKRLQEQAKAYWERFEQFVRFRPFGVMG
ncbi:hypothetical protein DNHGIG_25830 [Collibacillus ludicampi]|uniref:Uncharacterized protein n=1 Tax=Collibacillus ludicampi TaxID=2771369 RepID=A0AAV4LHN9_9BACL|nr:hypothetical protein [Collibacillus ludicampi]GIM47034.1 hypothetical protein DNHGIG_25830 [Collibacillus ludicampi]